MVHTTLLLFACCCFMLTVKTSLAFVTKTISSRAASRKSTTQRPISNLLDLMGGGNSKLIDPNDALPGRSTAQPNIGKHYVLGNDMKDVPDHHKVAVYGSGCFWGSEKGQWKFPMGIYSTAVGYCGGFTENPTYEETCSGKTGHTEGVRAVYDPNEIAFSDILRWFWESHDPTSGMGQVRYYY